MKTLLALGAGRLNLPALREMSKIAYVIALDRKPHETIDEHSLKTVSLDFSDQEALYDFAKQQTLDGVYPFSDHAIRPAARLVTALGLEGLEGDVAENFLDKSRMRELWAKTGLSQPEFAIVQDLKTAIKVAGKIGYPAIIKPGSSGGGGRGVFRVDSIEDLIEKYPLVAKENIYSNNIILEKFIQGVESSLEMIFVKKRGYLIALSTKTKRATQNKSQVATEIVYPAELPETIADKIVNLCSDAAIALGIDSGIAHFEVITNSDGSPYLVEVGGRAGGGHTFHPIASHVSGLNYPSVVANLYLKNYEEVERNLRERVRRRPAVYSFPVTEDEGRILEIEFRSKGPNSFVEIWKNKGDKIDGLNSSMDRLGCVVSTGEDLNVVKCEAKRLVQSFHIKLQ
jgi:biotin carboxylase